MNKKLIMSIFLAAAMFSGCTVQTAQEGNDRVTGQSGSLSVAKAKDGATAPAVTTNSGEVITIKDKMFIAQVNDIYTNYKDYLGKTIKYEGVFDSYLADEAANKYYYYVIRFGPGCCGNDGNVGFEVQLDGDSPEYPKQDDWVEVVGTLEQYDDDGYQYLTLKASSLTVFEERGLENVTQ
ncbi:hypothetical protein AGMMS49975_17110 [Clostridia bacterium]|nr:hypothetical protein AGMMS49975_17110 [Clostridia bacterium]